MFDEIGVDFLSISNTKSEKSQYQNYYDVGRKFDVDFFKWVVEIFMIKFGFSNLYFIIQ